MMVWGAKEVVFLYYDESYGYNPDGWGDWKSTKAIEDKIAEELTKAKVEFKIGTADEFLAYIEENPTGIVVSPIVVPEDVYSIGMVDKSPIEKWLNGGGTLIYSGDTPFYAAGKKDAPGQKIVPGDAGGNDVFNFASQYVTTAGAAVKPTELGKKYIPDLQPFNPNRPAQVNVLENEQCEPIEVYGDDGGNLADPVLFRTEEMKEKKGNFVHIHMQTLAQTPDLAQIGLEIAQLLINRFGEVLLGVEPAGKLAATWAEIKGAY